MTLAIQGARTASSREWDETWEACDYATYFHSRAWAELWERYHAGRMRPAPVLLEFTDGRRLVLPLTARVGRFGLLHGWESSPAGTFGGWISADPLTHDHVELVVERLRRDYPDLIWRINPYFAPRDYIDRLGARADVTHVLDLAGGYEAIAAGWTRDGGATARKIRKAERSGIRVREAASEQDWSAYVACYEASLSRWGDAASLRYSPRLFEILRELQSPHVRLWLAVLEEAVVAGALCFYARSHVVYWHGAARSEYFDRRPVNALMDAIIREACRSGHRWFDFNPSGSHAGVESFKASFGAVPLACPVVVQHATAHPALRLLRLAGRSIR
jgi:hypothetical protein